MDSAQPTQDELDAELKELRAGLRDYGKRVALHIQGMEMPKTPLEAERTARMVRATDQMLIQVYAPPAPPPRPRDTRSGQWSRARRGPDDDADDDDDEDTDNEDENEDEDDEPDHWKVVLERKLLKLAARQRELGLAGLHPGVPAAGPWTTEPDGCVAAGQADDLDQADAGIGEDDGPDVPAADDATTVDQARDAPPRSSDWTIDRPP